MKTEEERKPVPAIACTPRKTGDNLYQVTDTDGNSATDTTPNKARAELVMVRGDNAVHFLGLMDD